MNQSLRIPRYGRYRQKKPFRRNSQVWGRICQHLYLFGQKKIPTEAADRRQQKPTWTLFSILRAAWILHFRWFVAWPRSVATLLPINAQKAGHFLLSMFAWQSQKTKNVANVPKKYLRACVSDPGYNTRPLSQLIFCLVSVSPLSSQSLLVPQFNIFTCPSAGQLLTCSSAKLFSWPSTAQLPGTISMCVTWLVTLLASSTSRKYQTAVISGRVIMESQENGRVKNVKLWGNC